MTKLPIRPKPASPEHVDICSQTLPYRLLDTGTPTIDSLTAARHRSNGTTDDTKNAPNIPVQPTDVYPDPPSGLNDRYSDERYHLEADEKKNYRRNMLILAADVKERIASRGRHAHAYGRLHDSKLAESMRNLEKLVGCFEHLSPHPPRGRFDRPTQYLVDIKSFWITQDAPAAAVPYVPCWELMAGRKLTAQERAAIGIDVFLDGEIRGQRTPAEREGGGLGRFGNNGRFEGRRRDGGRRCGWLD
ncbi:hypothetical protein MMC17_005708 [Xylographa soralifera]|nr:hypothetical protein [Xylographa soralifera]